jgi:hypothetical protein
MPHWETCSVHSCEHQAVSGQLPYCASHLPVAQFVSASQLATARNYLKHGSTLYQAAVRIQADVRDLDLALWNGLGQQHRAAPMF